jgi:putative transposase
MGSLIRLIARFWWEVAIIWIVENRIILWRHKTTDIGTVISNQHGIFMEQMLLNSCEPHSPGFSRGVRRAMAKIPSRKEVLFIFLVYNIGMRGYKSNRNVVFSFKFHVVWCTKYRRTVIVDGAEERLKEILSGVAKERNAEIIALEVMPDHVHMLVEVDPQYGIHRFVKQCKGRSSRLLRREFDWMRTRLPTLWTNSYFVSSVGGAPLSVIKQYVEGQKHA